MDCFKDQENGRQVLILPRRCESGRARDSGLCQGGEGIIGSIESWTEVRD